MSGSSNLVQSGPGTTLLKGANSFGGSTYLQGGVLQVSQVADTGPSSIGDTGNLFLYGGTTLELTSGNSRTARQVYVLGTNAANIQVDPGASLTFSGNFQYYGSGSNAFNVSGGGTFSLTSNSAGPWNTLNAVTGTVTTVLLGGPVNQINDIGSGAKVTINSSSNETYSSGLGVGINSGGTFDLNGFGQTISALNSTNPAALVTNNGLSPSLLTIGNTTNNLSGSYAGSISDGTSTLALTKAGNGTLILSGVNRYTGGTNVSAGTLVLASGTAFPSGTSNAGTGLTVSSGAILQIANHGVAATITPFVNVLNNNGTIDITNNAMVIKGASASLGTISNEIAAAYNGGAWNGTSGLGIITSSLAAADTAHLTAVGIATGFSGFENGTVLPGDVLIKYTYYGDANLDSKVDSSDYGRIDNGYLSRQTGWYNGDFNYDNLVNGSDYTLIDNTFNVQGAQITSTIASPTARIAGAGASSTVPEPASLALFGVGAAGLLGRRRRRR